MSEHDVYIDNGRILDEEGFELNPDLIDYNLGYLQPEEKLIAHHDAQPEVEREFHYIVKTFYFEDGTKYQVKSQDDPHIKVVDMDKGVFDYVDQGEGKVLRGIDLEEYEDVPQQEAKPEYNEYETFQRYILYTPEELAERAEAEHKAKIQQHFMETGPERLDETEINVEDLTLLMAEMIGV